MEFFRNTNIDFLGKKWYFLAFSLIFSVAGLFSIFFWHHIPLGVEFRGGTLVYVKFAQTPNLDDIRHQMDRAGLKDPKIQNFGPPTANEVLVDLGIQETSEAALDQGKNTIIRALEPQASTGKQEPVTAGRDRIKPRCSLVGKESSGLNAGDVEEFAAALVLAGCFIVEQHHITGGFSEFGAIPLIGLTRQAVHFAPDQPAQFVGVGGSAVGAIQRHRFYGLRFTVEGAFVHR